FRPNINFCIAIRHRLFAVGHVKPPFRHAAVVQALFKYENLRTTTSIAMENIRSRIEPYAFALFRIVFGLLFLQFGTQKLFEWPSVPVGYTPETILIVAAWIELVSGFLIMIGLLAHMAAFVASGEMAFAYFLGHFPVAFWPVVSRGVPAVLFCFAFLFIAV